jgi:hypothetical protein
MGYELDRLVRQYGLSTPTIQNYSGEKAPTGPAPVNPTAPTALVAPTLREKPTVIAKPSSINVNKATPQQIADYNAKLDAFNVYQQDLTAWNTENSAYKTALNQYNKDLPTYNTALAKYNTDLGTYNAYNAANQTYLNDQAAYNDYRNNFLQRFSNAPMYLNKQFNTALTPTDDPGRELYNQTGNYYSDVLRAPSYSGINTQSETSGVSNSGSVTPGTGPGGQNLTFNAGVRGYYVNGAAPNPLTVLNGQPNTLPSGVPAGAQWNATKKQYFVPYAHGGNVRTHYDEGDLVDLSKKYDNPDEMSNINPGFINNAMAPQDTSGVPMAMVTQRPAMPPQPQAAATEMPKSNLETIMATLAKYTGTGPDYANELKTARTAAKAESDKFAQMITDAMKNQTSAPSKEELYWKLASAFGSPTKTGTFSEQLSNVGSVAADYAKSVREAQKADLSTKMQLALKGQELKVAGTKEDLSSLRTLAAEDMKDKRTITTELLKEYVKSGEPQSTAGKQARDEGLKPGTPEFQERVKAIAASNLEAQTAKIESLLAGISTAQANLLLNQTKFDYAKEKDTKLTPAEVKMKSDTEELLGNANQALKDIQQAYKLNPNTFDSSLMDKGTRLLLENTSSNDPKVVATRTMENLLSKEAVGKLRASFGANPTEGERGILLQLEGINSKSREERAAIMRNTYEALKASVSRQNKRLNEINAGMYRNTTQTGGLE